MSPELSVKVIDQLAAALNASVVVGFTVPICARVMVRAHA